MTASPGCRLAPAIAVAAVLAASGALVTGAPARARGQADRARSAIPLVTPTVNCTNPRAADQDDMCIWIHPTDPAKSTIVASDKAAGALFVYDLAGRVLQSLSARLPGNIDLRYGFALGGGKVDVVAFNQRSGGPRIVVYAVDPTTRRLRRVDNGRVETGSNYGGTLFRSPKTGKLYFFTTSSSRIEQHELFDDGTGKVAGRKVRSWKLGLCEGAVGDDEAGKVYFARESRGVWEVGGEPTDPAPGKQVIRVGDNGLRSDVEGLTIYPLPGGAGYLIVSSQGNSMFKVYERGRAHRYLGTFRVRGVSDTDGVDVTNAALGAAFPQGLLACHNNAESPCPVVLVPWERVARALQPALRIDTSWDPRKPAKRRPGVEAKP